MMIAISGVLAVDILLASPLWIVGPVHTPRIRSLVFYVYLVQCFSIASCVHQYSSLKRRVTYI